MARNNLNDVINGDRADIRANHVSIMPPAILPKPSNHPDVHGYYSKSKCAHSHPALKLGTGTLIGGSCIEPVVTDADAYIGFDHGMRPLPYDYTTQRVDHIYFHIPDMHVPKDVDGFKKLVTWTADQLQAGKKIHCGCFGGHGRTGMFIAAVVKEMTGEEDAIKWVRANYCVKAVEANSQSDFLHKHYGITPVTGYKQSTEYNKSHSRGIGGQSKPKKGKVTDQLFTTMGPKDSIFE